MDEDWESPDGRDVWMYSTVHASTPLILRTQRNQINHSPVAARADAILPILTSTTNYL